jgi:hypothetical protein
LRPDQFPEENHDHVLYSKNGTLGEQPQNEVRDCKVSDRSGDSIDALYRLAYAIAECDPDDACKVMEAAISDLRRGMPIAPFLTIMDEARTWASFAMRAELKAYCLACFEHMPKSDQGAFLRHVGGAHG